MFVQHASPRLAARGNLQASIPVIKENLMRLKKWESNENLTIEEVIIRQMDRKPSGGIYILNDV